MLRNLITILLVSVIYSHSKTYAQDQEILLIGNCEINSAEIMLEYLQTVSYTHLTLPTTPYV